MSRRRPHAAHCVWRHTSRGNLRRPRKPGRWSPPVENRSPKQRRSGATAIARTPRNLPGELRPFFLQDRVLARGNEPHDRRKPAARRLPTDRERRNEDRPPAWIGDSLDDEVTVDLPVEHHAFWHWPAARPGSWRGRRTLRGSRPNWTCKATWAKRLWALRGGRRIAGPVVGGSACAA